MLLYAPLPSNATQHIVFFVPDDEGSSFWKDVTTFAEAAARDFNLELEFVRTDNRFDKLKSFISVLERTQKVDAIVVKLNFEIEGILIDLAERAQIPVLTFNAKADEMVKNILDKPLEDYQYWLGEVIPNEFQTSAEVTRLLFDQARHKEMFDVNGKVQTIAISAEKNSQPSINRLQGFLSIVESSSDITVNQSAFSHWSTAQARLTFEGLMKRYPQSKVCWTGVRSLQILRKAKELGLLAGTDFVMNSGILRKSSLLRVKSGEIVAAAGGHYVDGAWAIAFLYDYFNGYNFNKKNSQLLTKMAIVTHENVDLYLSKITSENYSRSKIDEIDFTRFSRILNPELATQNLGIELLLKQL